MLLKFWAWIYRKTGYYSHYARAQECKEMWRIINKTPDNEPLDKTDLFIGVGCWQAKHRFYRTSKQVIKKLRKRK